MNRLINASKFVAVFAMAMALCLASTPLLASCRITDGSYPRTIPIDFGLLSVSPDTPVGAVVASRPINTGESPSVQFICDADTTIAYGVRATNPLVRDKIFDSGVSGVGYKVYDSGDYADFLYDYDIEGGVASSFSLHPTIYLIKTGPITAGGFTKGIWSKTTADALGDLLYIRLDTGSVVESTCDDIGPKSIELGRISAAAIAGNTSAGDKMISIPMNCGAGFRIFAKLTGVAPAGSTADGLIQNTGTAEGVSVQLIDGNNQPIKLGEKVEQTNNGANTVYKIGARAYKTGTVGAGSINAQATLTMTYE